MNMTNKGRAKYLIMNTLIFGIGNIATRLISFFLIPMYTAVLSTSEYGVIDLMMAVITVTVPIVTLNIVEAVMRFALDQDADRGKITQVGTVVYLSGCVVGILVIPVCNLFERLSQYGVIAYISLVTMAGSQLYLCDLRGKELLFQYSIGNIIQSFLIAILNVIFLVYLQMGVKGYFLAYALASVLVMAYALAAGRSYKSLKIKRIDISLFKNMTKYSIVLIPNSFLWWLMNSSDRIMVSALVGVDANGVYAISYKLPSLVTVVASIFTQAWGYSAVKEKGSDDEEKYNNKVFICLTSISMMIGITMCSFSKLLLRVYVMSEYYEAWKYMPFLIIGCVYLTLGSFIATSYNVHKDSFGFLFSSMFGALFNIILNFILIPSMQVYGAALATCVSYILVFMFRFFHTKKYLKYDIKTGEFMFGTVVLFASAILMFVENIMGQIIQIFLFCVSMIFYLYSEREILLRISKGMKNMRLFKKK